MPSAFQSVGPFFEIYDQIISVQHFGTQTGALKAVHELREPTMLGVLSPIT
jgi:hypothetical protein